MILNYKKKLLSKILPFFILAFIILLISISAQEINTESGSKKNKFVFFVSLSDCKTCPSLAEYFKNNEVFRYMLTKEFDIVYYLNCNRQRDVEYYKKKYDIKFPLYRDTLNLKQKYKIPPRIDFAIIDTSGNLLNYDSVMNKIMQKIKK
jgi:thioredoxin-related protein